MFLADFQLPPVVNDHLPWFIALVVVIAALLLAGVTDLGRLVLDGGWRRAWAISGVCFQESIRRRVLWMIPVAIVGVIVAVQLLKPVDEQDALRQTVKYALFTSGALVVLSTIILAATNLPREIDNRVIYTVVTKPTTRLEIVLGKVIGFARVSGTILLIMGAFTFAYAQLRATHLRSRAAARLEVLSPTDPSRPSLQHYAQYGLLESKSYALPANFAEYARVPAADDKLRWIGGSHEQAFVIPFDLPYEMLPNGADPGSNGGLEIVGQVEYQAGADNKEWAESSSWHPTPFPGELPDPNQFRNFYVKRKAEPTIEFELLGADHYSLVGPRDFENGGSVALPLQHNAPARKLGAIPAKALDKLCALPADQPRRVYLRVEGSGPFEYGVGRGAIHLFSPKLNRPLDGPKDPDGEPAWPEFQGRLFMNTQQLKGASDPAKASVAVYEFRGTRVPPGGAPLPMELRVGIEGSGDETSESDAATYVEADATNLDTGRRSAPVRFPIEANRTAFFTLPPDAVAGGNFDVHLRCFAAGHYLVIHPVGANSSLLAVTSTEPFAWNLTKSLLVMWMLALLVVIVSIFCSTFVSWPIAVVLTVVILMAHWGAEQIGDTSTPGLGASMARDLGLQDPAASKVFGSTVESLSAFLNVVSKVMPDIGQFAATEDIERGVTIAPRVLGESAKVILAFGVPLTLLAYVFLKRKEVAP